MPAKSSKKSTPKKTFKSMAEINKEFFKEVTRPEPPSDEQEAKTIPRPRIDLKSAFKKDD